MKMKTKTDNNDSAVVRKAEKRDIKSLMALLYQVDAVHHAIRPDLFKPDAPKYNEKELEAILDDDHKPIFVYDDGKVLGQALFEFVRDFARSIGCRNITLNVWEGNDAALHFYKRMGMQVQKTGMEMLISDHF